MIFLDEIHRFNRAQQDGFLPFVEAGVVTLVGATTENPSFELVRSRQKEAASQRKIQARLDQVGVIDADASTVRR